MKRTGGRATLVVVAAMCIPCIAAPNARADAFSFGSGVAPSGQLGYATGIAVGSGGSVYVADGAIGATRIERFTATGDFLSSWGEDGSGDGQFGASSNSPNSVAVGLGGHVYVTDSGNHRVQEFTAAGTFVRAWGTDRPGDPPNITTPVGIATAPNGDVYVADGRDRIQQFDSDGTFLGLWSVPSADSTEDVAVGLDGAVYVADVNHQRVRKYSAAGTLLDQWGSAGNAVGRFNGPWGLGIAPDGHVLVADQNNNRVQEFTTSGNFLGTFGSLGSGVTNLRDPRDVAVSPSGRVYIADLNNNRVVSLDYEPTARIASPGVIDTGQDVALDGSASLAPLSSITNFLWDLNGDGSYETNTGTRPAARYSSAEAGIQNVGLRVTSTKGLTADTSIALDVRQASPVGPLGVSINAGDQFTNDPKVKVSSRWPRFAQTLVISNDGGFTPFSRLAVAPEVDWMLDSSGPERLPKTIYVRFAGGQSGPETYQDDIILDETAPLLQDVAIKSSDSSNSRPSLARKGSKLKLRIKAKDKTSGVAEMQVTSKKSKPGDWKNYKKSASLKTNKSKAFVRVRDGAGNVSKWKRAE